MGMRKQRTRVAAVPTAPSVSEMNSMDQEAYVLDYLPPRTIAAISNDPRKLPSIKVYFNGLKTLALVDSCAYVSYCRESTAHKADLTIQKLKGENTNLTAANDSNIQIYGKVSTKIRIKDPESGKFGEWGIILFVSPDKHCPGPILMGLPLLMDLKGVIALGERKVRLGEIWTNIVSVIGSETVKPSRVILDNTEIFEPRTENILMAKINENYPTDQNFLVESISHKYPGIIVGRTLVAPGNSKNVVLHVLNAGNAPIKIYENSHLADLEPITVNALPGDEISPKDYIPPETKWSENLPNLPEKGMNRVPSERLNLDGSLQTVHTGWINPVRVPLQSFVPENLIQMRTVKDTLWHGFSMKILKCTFLRL